MKYIENVLTLLTFVFMLTKVIPQFFVVEFCTVIR